MRFAIAGALTLVGAASVIAGIALVYPPAALIVAGLAVAAVGLLSLDVTG